MKKSLFFIVGLALSLSGKSQIELQLHFEQNPGNEIKIYKKDIFSGEEEVTHQFLLTGEGKIRTEHIPKLSPGFYSVYIQDIGRLELALDEGDKPLIIRDGHEIKIEGSRATDLLRAYEMKRETDFNDRVKPVRDSAEKAQKSGDTAKAAELSAREQSAYNEHRDFLIDHAYENMQGSVSAYVVIKRRKSGKNIKRLEKLVESVASRYPDHEMNKPAKERVEILKNTLIGARAPEFALPDPERKERSLPELYGKKATLIEFWASWCGPCRRINPEMNELYDKFSDLGVTFIYISLDKNRSKWKDAVEEDKLRGIHLSDLKGYQSETVQQYGITSIPAGFLLGPEGRIKAKDVKGKALRELLKELTE